VSLKATPDVPDPISEFVYANSRFEWQEDYLETYGRDGLLVSIDTRPR